MYRSVLGSIHKYGDEYGEAANRMFVECRHAWMKLRVCQLFFDNVSASDYVMMGIKVITNSIEDLESAMLDAHSLERIEVALVTSITNCHESVTKIAQASAEEDYESFKSYCVSFFIDVVKDFVFGDHNNQHLSNEVIGKLMSYVCSSSGTKKFSPMAEHALDPSPVIRSFLLKQLLESSKRTTAEHESDDGGVESHVAAYLQRSIDHVQKDVRSEWGVYVMFVHCYEDFFTEEAMEMRRAGPNNSLYVDHVVSCLQQFVEKDIDDHTVVSVELLQSVARIRFALTSTATILFDHVHADEDEKNESTAQTQHKKLFAYLFKFIDSFANREIHLFFVRMIIRRYGLRELDNIVKATGFDWLNVKESGGDSSHRHPDKYLVYGETYKKLRNEVTEGLMADKEKEEIKLMVENNEDHSWLVPLVGAQECFLGLNQLTENMKNILENSSLPQNLQTPMVQLTTSIEDQSLLELMLHFTVMLQNTNSHHLVLPFRNMACHPARMRGSFFPAMPSDIIKEIEAARPGENDKWTVYSCPNGHRYVIGNCGQAAVASKCNVCDAPIGGVNHVLDATNTAVGFADASLPCHNLGSVLNRGQHAVPERNLSPLAATIQLFLVHASLLYGVVTGCVGVEQLIQPPTTEDLRTFLIAHIQRDIEIMQGSMAKSADDVYILLHLLMKNILVTCNNGGNLSQPSPLPFTRYTRPLSSAFFISPKIFIFF